MEAGRHAPGSVQACARLVLGSRLALRQRPVDDKWIRPFATVTPEDALHDALETLQRRGSHVARVVDQEGVTLGLVTLEDVIEELVGEIRDAAHADEVPTN